MEQSLCVALARALGITGSALGLLLESAGAGQRCLALEEARPDYWEILA